MESIKIILGGIGFIVFGIACFILHNYRRINEITDFYEPKKPLLIGNTYEVTFNVPVKYDYNIILFEKAQDGVAVELKEIPIKVRSKTE